MVIEWKKILEDPEKDVKVVGQLLLDNKNKIEALEKELSDSEAQREELKSGLNEANSKINEFEEKLKEETEKLSESEKNFNSLQSEKQDLSDVLEKTETEFKGIQIEKEALQKLIALEKTQTCDLQANVEQLNNKNTEFESTIQDISNELSAKTLALEKAEESLNNLSDLQKTLEAKDTEIKTLSELIEEKDNLINQISEELKQKKDESLGLSEKIKQDQGKIKELSLKIPKAPAAISSPVTVSSPAPTIEAPWMQEDIPFKIFLVQGDELQEAEGFTSAQVAIIVDKQNTKIWVWKGATASVMNAVKASTRAPTIRSSLMLYNWKIEFIDQGKEPDDFPLKTIA